MAPDNRLHEPLAALLARPQGAWRALIEQWQASEAGNRLQAFVDARVASGTPVYPAHPLRALELTPLERTRVVILGQDPYHGAGQAEGLAFSVPPGVRIPPSLRNIFKELDRDLGLPPPSSGHLGAWARRGVLLLNTTLTVEDASPGSHSGKGWEVLTDSLVRFAAQDQRPKVFMLWGAHAQALGPALDQGASPHLVLKANHPSPLSASRGASPFSGCGHFRKASDFLAAAEPNERVLDWRLD